MPRRSSGGKHPGPEPRAEPGNRPEPPPRVAWLHTFPARVVYYLSMLGAVIAFARVYGYGRLVAGMGEPGVSVGQAVPLGLLWLLVLGSCLFVLALFIYEDMRARGELARPSRLFERLLRRGPRE